MLVKHRPVRAKGRPAKTTEENVAVGNINYQRLTGSNSRAYIEQRLSRDFPEIWTRIIVVRLPHFLVAGAG
jgi:hypothetical protein